MLATLFGFTIDWSALLAYLPFLLIGTGAICFFGYWTIKEYYDFFWKDPFKEHYHQLDPHPKRTILIRHLILSGIFWLIYGFIYVVTSNLIISNPFVRN